MPNPSIPPADGSCPLLDKLPPELRLMIWTLTLRTTPLKCHYDVSHRPYRPNLLKTCRLIRHESIKPYCLGLENLVFFRLRNYVADCHMIHFIRMHKDISAEEKDRHYRTHRRIQRKYFNAFGALKVEKKRFGKEGWPLEAWAKEMEDLWRRNGEDQWKNDRFMDVKYCFR